MKTFSLKNTEVTRNWVVFDASDRVLGRFATKIADKLRGKDKPTFTPHVDGGDFVVVINAEKVKVTGKKSDQKKYFKHSMFKKLKVYRGSEHPHESQNPTVWNPKI